MGLISVYGNCLLLVFWDDLEVGLLILRYVLLTSLYQVHLELVLFRLLRTFSYSLDGALILVIYFGKFNLKVFES